MLDLETIKKILEYATTFFCIGGNFYIAKQNITGFYWWIIGNLLGLTLFYIEAKWGFFSLYLFYNGFNIYSIYEWKKKEKELAKLLQEKQNEK